MPSSSAIESEMLAAGYRKKETRPCRKCQVPVEVWRNPSGGEVEYNTSEHPTAPGIIHFLTCSEQLEEWQKHKD